MRATNIQCLALALTAASAHSIMQAVGVGSTVNKQGLGIYMPSDDSYIADVTSDSLACNGAPVSYFTSSSSVINVQAGDTVTGSWLHTLTSTGPDSDADNKVIDSSHKGPVMAYLKKVADATQNPSAGPGDGWFKIAEAGLISSTEWAVDALISAGGVQNVTIPTCIEDGDYLLRFEIIALHSAYSLGGAQFYMECAQISVSGGSGSSSPSTVSIPGTYSATDPGIEVNIYNGQGQPYPASGSYVIPGPPVFTCPAVASSASPVSSSASSSTEASPATTTSSMNAVASSYQASPTTTTSSMSEVANSYEASPTTTASTTNATTSSYKARSSHTTSSMNAIASSATPSYAPTTFVTSALPVAASSKAPQTFVCQAY